MNAATLLSFAALGWPAAVLATASTQAAAAAGPCGTLAAAASHPSLPNYMAGTSGLSGRQIKIFDSDCSPSKKCSTPAPSIFGQDESWKAYEESMPTNCAPANSGEYAVRHNPPPYYTSLSGCSTLDVPYSQLASDLASNSLPAFSFVTHARCVYLSDTLQPLLVAGHHRAAPQSACPGLGIISHADDERLQPLAREITPSAGSRRHQP